MEKRVEVILDFLSRLKENNDREWFAEHKKEYNQTKVYFEEIVTEMLARIATIDPQVKGLEAKDCLFRIYRDTRFSSDKTPYKTYWGAYMAGNGGRKSVRAGYYLHLEPETSFFSGGIWCPEPKILKALRMAIHENIDEFTEIMENPEFKSHYSPLMGEKLKTVPQPFSRDLAHGDWLKYKNYAVESGLPESFFTEDWQDKCLDLCRILKPFNDFMNYTVDEELNL